MINTDLEIDSKPVFEPKSLPSFQVQPGIGSLLLDTDYKVRLVNNDYVSFHQLFHISRPEPGIILDQAYFSTYPESFATIIDEVISGAANKNSLQIEYMGEEMLSFKIEVLAVNDSKSGFTGAHITVAKKDRKTSEKPNINSLYKHLVDTSTSVYQLADAALVYTYTCDSIYNTLGFLPAEMNGRNALELVHPDDKDLVRDWLINVRRHPGRLFTLEYRMRNKTGNYIWIENNARNMLNDDNVKGVVMNFRDIQSKKVADDALIHAEQRLSLLLNNTEESFIILNSRLRIVTYNKAAQDRSPFFYNKSLQSGLSVLDLIGREEIPDYIALFEQVFRGKEIERETKLTDDKGILHIYSHTYRPLFDTQKDIFGVFITSTEITERKKLTEEVALHSERLKTAQQIAKLGYFEYDAISGHLYCSDQFRFILGIDQRLTSWKRLVLAQRNIPIEDRELLKIEFRKTLATGKDFTTEFRYSTAEIAEKVILAIGSAETNSVGKIVKFKLTLQDITDSKMATLALQSLESKFKSLFDNSIDGVILSKESGEIISANPSVCQMLGYTQEELTFKKSMDLLDMQSPLVERMMEIRREDNGAYIGELLLKHKDGHFIPVEVTSISMKDGKDDTYLSTIIRDITEKKKIESEQKALTEELLKNNQDLQQFSFITSHNLRAPVANLLSLLSLFNKEKFDDDFNKLLIEKFEEATQQLNQTLNDLVNVLVIKSNNNIEKESICLTDIYIEVKKNIDNLLRQQNGKIWADFSEVDQLKYNRIHIESIFLNMISNAIRYSSSDRSPEIKIKSYKYDNWVVVEFADNGLGMDLKRYGDRLFGLYQRFHGNKEGKGLGLYMTRSQVIAMGGKIEVESEPGVGTTFKIYFKL